MRCDAMSGANRVGQMAMIWLVPTSVLMVASIVTARMAVQLKAEAGLVEVDLAEVAEAIDVVGRCGSELDETSGRIEHLIGAVGGPLRLVKQARRTTKHWWWRARRSSHEPPVPS